MREAVAIASQQRSAMARACVARRERQRDTARAKKGRKK